MTPTLTVGPGKSHKPPDSQHEGQGSPERADFESWLSATVNRLSREAGRTTAPYAQTRLLGRLDGLRMVQDRLQGYSGGARANNITMKGNPMTIGEDILLENGATVVAFEPDKNDPNEGVVLARWRGDYATWRVYRVGSAREWSASSGRYFHDDVTRAAVDFGERAGMSPPNTRYVVRCADYENAFRKRTSAEALAELNDRSDYCPHEHVVVEQVWGDGAWVDA